MHFVPFSYDTNEKWHEMRSIDVTQAGAYEHENREIEGKKKRKERARKTLKFDNITSGGMCPSGMIVSAGWSTFAHVLQP